ncbi:MAG TPA: hypothetical protein VFV19_08480 [Candidatus Polarisedimenticolaceae bacterium]|nr:hypothetical protein [Candidatus Polarisedimenticolaceae bacterium]
MRPTTRLAFAFAVVCGLLLAPAARAAVQQVWISQVDPGPTTPPSDDTGERIAIDGVGNVLIAGRAGRVPETARVLVAKLSANGALQWQRPIDATAPAIFDGPLFLGLDGTGNVLLAWQESIHSGGVEIDAPIRLAKIGGDGSDIWRTTYNPSDFVTLGDFAVTADGGLVIVGTSAGTTGNDGLALTVKIGSSGAVQWEDRFSTAHELAAATAVAIDPSSGAVVVGGSSAPSGSESKTLFIQYDATGHRQWSKRIASDRILNFEEVFDIAVTPSGNILASGRRTAFGGPFHSQGLLYELRGTNGKLDWSRFSAPSTNDVEFDLVRTDSTGNAIVAGSSNDSPNSTSDRLVARFLADGTPVWSQILDLRPVDVISGLALDAAGNAFTTGYSTDFNLADPTVWVTSRFDAATGHAWDVTLDVATYYDWDKGLDVALTPAGEIVVTGRTLNTVSPSTFSGDATTIKYAEQ